MFEIGWATRDITPPRPAMIQGQKHRRVGESPLDPITVTAWTIGKGGQTAAIVSCDLTAPSANLLNEVRTAVAGRVPDLPPEAVVLVATHTHTSLVLEEGFFEHPGGNVMEPEEARAHVAGKIIEAIDEAWHRRRPRRIRRAWGHAVVGHNRYAVYQDRSAAMYGKTNREDFRWFGGYEDHSFDLFAAYEEDGALAGLMLAIPCPSQVDEHLSQFSADYWHEVRTSLRRRFGDHLSVLPLCGAAGDQSPHFLIYGELEREMRERRGLSERQEIADRVTRGVKRALETCTDDVDDILAHRSTTLSLTPRSISRKDRDLAEQIYREAAAAGDTTSWFPKRARRVVDIFDGVEHAAPVAAEIHVLRLGDAVVATNPFELFLDYGLQIKARSVARQTAVVQLAGWGFYLPTERAVEAGSYGAFPLVSAVGPEGGRELVEATLSTIRELLG